MREDDDESNDKEGSIAGVNDEYKEEYELNIEDDITYIEEIEREELQELENEGILTPGVDTEEENTPQQINQEENTKRVITHTQQATPIHILEPTMRGNTYHINNLITQTVAENEYSIDYKT